MSVSTAFTASKLRLTSGRVTALAVGVPVALMLIGWTGFGLVGSLLGEVSYPFSYAVAVHDGQVTAEVPGANVTLQVQPGPAKLTGSAQYGLFRPQLTAVQTATSTMLMFNCRAFPIGNCSLDNTTLDVPPATAVSLTTDGGDLSLSDFTGPLTLNTQGGNLQTGNLTGGVLQLNSGGGDVTTGSLAGPLQVSAQGGNVFANAVTGQTATIDSGGGDVTLTSVNVSSNLQITAEGGNVNLNTVAAPAATVQSGGGDVNLTFTQVPHTLQITADGGNVQLVLPANARYDIQTTAQGGNVSNDVASDPLSPNKIIVDSGGGDIFISGES